MIKVETFPANNGDCFLIHTPEGLILIDCGYVNTYKDHLKKVLQKLHLEGKKILRFIITHIDEDHIQGALMFLAENGSVDSPKVIKIDQIWHNSYRHLQSDKLEGNIDENSHALLTSTIKEIENKVEKQVSGRQGSSLAGLILKNGYNWNTDFREAACSIDHFNEISISDQISFELLSPTDKALQKLEKHWKKELIKLGFRDKITNEEIFDDAFEYMMMLNKTQPDENAEQPASSGDFDVQSLKKQLVTLDSAPKNGSSIAFILNAYEKKMLFLGDAIPSIVDLELEKRCKTQTKPLWFDLIKLSHHGSFANNSTKFFELTDSTRYLISTNGLSSPHPDRQTLAWTIDRPTEEPREIFFNYDNERFKLINNEELKKMHNFIPILSDKPQNRIIIL